MAEISQAMKEVDIQNANMMAQLDQLKTEMVQEDIKFTEKKKVLMASWLISTRH
jgi:hypothetical protein